MNEKTPPPERSGDYVPKSEIADALADVLEDQKTRKRIREGARGPGSRRGGPAGTVALVLLALVSAYLWFGSPSWLDTSGDNPVDPQLLAAGARMEIYLQALRLEAFRSREGRLPQSLAEAGGNDSDVEYERLDGQRYRLSMTGPAGVVSYMSTSPLDDFLGDAVTVIRGGVR